jgi:ABC-type branched-subunit amino acid transport system substrate-binding protein
VPEGKPLPTMPSFPTRSSSKFPLSFSVSLIVLALLVPGRLSAAPLTDLEQQGQEIYRKGTSANGSILAKFGSGRNSLSAQFLPCVNCHGLDGTGRPEGTLEPPDITWAELTKPYGHTHSDGRSHGPFDSDSLTQAVIKGVDPAGNKLHPAMPRYALKPQDAEALVAYLKVIDRDIDPGLSDTVIKLGVILPGKINDKNPLYALLRGYFSELNENGGIYGRKVDLVFSKSFKDTQSYIENVQHLVKTEEVFALLGASQAEADKKISPLLEVGSVPLVTPLVLTKWTRIEQQPFRFRLFPGPAQQAQVLMAFANTRLKPSPKTAIIMPPEGEIYGQIWDIFQRELKRYGWPDFESISYSGNPKEIPEIVNQLSQAGTQAVFYFCPAGKLAPLMQEAAKQKWNPYIFAPMSVAARESLALPEAFSNRVFLANPSLPSAYDKKSIEEFQRLLAKYKIPKFYQVQALYYLATAKVLVEGLQRSGQKLSRNKLLKALESLSNFETGLTPKISFGLNRRTGSLGAYILEVDLKKRQFKPGAVWTRLD